MINLGKYCVGGWACHLNILMQLHNCFEDLGTRLEIKI